MDKEEIIEQLKVLKDRNKWTRQLEVLYNEYRHSMPSKNEGGQDNSLFFRPLPYSHLTVADVTFGTPREVAREALDTHFIGGITKGIIWPWPYTGYYWRSEIEPTLVVLRDVVRYYAEKYNTENQ